MRGKTFMLRRTDHKGWNTTCYHGFEYNLADFNRVVYCEYCEYDRVSIITRLTRGPLVECEHCGSRVTEVGCIDCDCAINTAERLIAHPEDKLDSWQPRLNPVEPSVPATPTLAVDRVEQHTCDCGSRLTNTLTSVNDCPCGSNDCFIPGWEWVCLDCQLDELAGLPMNYPED